MREVMMEPGLADTFPFTRVTLPHACARIARCVLGADGFEERIGDVVLHAHQMSAARRIARLLDREGGALLADAVGLGKTYTALAVGATRGPILVIAPAALRSMWLDALDRTQQRGDFASFEALSRGRIAPDTHRFVIVDEAHHTRNPSTRRYDRVARACAHADVLLLSATPLHNSRVDVTALLALFLGSRAYELTDDEVARFIVRRTERPDDQHMPSIRHMPPCVAIQRDGVLDAITALPSPLPPRDGGVATQLHTIGLVRQWVSSDAALSAALRRRIGRGESLLSALESGRHPTAHELAAWVCGDDSVQLAFPELLVPSPSPLGDLATSVRGHVAAIRSLYASTSSATDDAIRAAFIEDVRRRHPTEKIVAFTEFAETARALYRAMRHHGRVAVLTAGGGHVAGGPLARAELLARFAPRAMGTSAPRAAEEITLLIATDLLSEGVNLQDASVIVHLDLPWTPSRLTQRTGRLARLGAMHDSVTSYTIVPPPRVDAWLRANAILAAKAQAAARLIGGRANLSHVADDDRAAESPVGSAEQIRAMLRAILVAVPDADTHPPVCERPFCAAARTNGHGTIRALVAVRDGVDLVLLGVRDDGGVTTRSSHIERTLRAILAGANTTLDETRVASVSAAALRWIARGRAAIVAGVSADSHASVYEKSTFVGAARAARARHSITRGATSLHTASPYARRAALAELAGRVRRVAMHAIPIAIEREVRELSHHSASTADTTRLIALLDRLEKREHRTDSGAHSNAVLAIIVIEDIRDSDEP